MTRVFQRDVALEIVDGHTDVLVDLSHVFLDNYDRLVGPIEAGIHDGDNGTVESAAHDLKGSLGYFGNSMLMQEIAELEEAARNGDVAAVRRLFSALRDKLEQLMIELQSFVAQFGDSHRSR